MNAAIAPITLASPIPIQPLTIESTVPLNSLVVDNDRFVREACKEAAAALGYHTTATESAEQAFWVVDSESIDVVLLDLNLPGAGGLDVMRQIKRLQPNIEVILMTGNGTVQLAVQAMKAGAYDFVAKPFGLNDPKLLLERVADLLTLKVENRRLCDEMKTKRGYGNLIGRTPEMDRLYRIIGKAARSEHPVLILGESGTGKEMVARAVHYSRPFHDTPFVPGGFADDLFNTLFRLEAGRMKEHGYEWGTTGRSSFTQDYGVLETITKVEPADNKCSKAKTTTVVRRKPGASPLLFGEFLMQLCAFVFLENISGELSPYEETYLSVAMDPPMREAYGELEDDIRQALKEHKGNRSVLSIMLNTLLLYADHPYGLGTLYGAEFDSDSKRKVPFVIARTRDLPEDSLYSKERRLLQEIKRELADGRRCQVFAVYTRKHDVTARLERILSNEGIRTAVLRANVDTSKREAWYARQIKDGVQVVISHPKLVETGRMTQPSPRL